MMYCVDLRSKITHHSVMTIFKTDSHDRAWDVANNYNKINGNTDEELEMLNNEKTMGLTPNLYWATVYDDCKDTIESNIKEDKTMKKYTLKDYKDFSSEALVCPPMEEFEDGTIDEEKWYEDHKIRITVGEHEIEIGYFADTVNEIDFALKEMYEEEYGSGEPTTGNTVDSEYRNATLKDIIHVAIQHDWEDWGYKHEDLILFLRAFVNKYDNITNIMGVYDDVIYEDLKYYNDIFKCNFSKLDMFTLRHIDRPHIQKVIEDLVCTDMELLVGYDNEMKCSDITFVMDHTFKQSGELIAWFYGEADDDYVKSLIDNYKKKLFKEEN